MLAETGILTSLCVYVSIQTQGDTKGESIRYSRAILNTLSVAIVPSACFYVHFEVLHQKRAKKKANFDFSFLTFAKIFNNGRWIRIDE